MARPKPPRDADAEQLLGLCREGRLFELQAWIAAGRPLTIPAHYRHTPLRVAVDTGFHSLIELLLQHENDQAVKDDVLRHACWRDRRAVMQLALEHGANVNANLRELMAAAAPWSVAPESVAYLVRLGAGVNDKADGGSTVLDRCLNSFGWKEAVLDDWYTKTTVPMARLGSSLEALRFVLEKGARWTPDDRSIVDTRRALYRVEGDAIAAVVDLLRTHKACNEASLSALVRAPKMRSILAEVARRRAGTERRARPAASERGSRERAVTRTSFRNTPDVRQQAERRSYAELSENRWTQSLADGCALTRVDDGIAIETVGQEEMGAPRPPSNNDQQHASPHHHLTPRLVPAPGWR